MENHINFNSKIRRIFRINMLYWVMSIGWIPFGIGVYHIMKGYGIFLILLLIIPYMIGLNALGAFLRKAKCPRCDNGFFLPDSDFWESMGWIPFRLRCQSCKLSVLEKKT